ncbi:hypothetical protein M271_11450 [Streptomyces rapamycinicus NRRL 5491]|nr:hypothetical protein M271_11450 [Streptomyces rapamycinicus NRRL 5491]
MRPPDKAGARGQGEVRAAGEIGATDPVLDVLPAIFEF